MATHPIRFGLQTGQQTVGWSDLRDLWTKADGQGWDSLWLFDHFYPIFIPPEGPCLEGWTALAALAGVTKRARIGHLVNGVTYRNPALLAKMATTVDHVSEGRLNLGLGAGWFELEHRQLGFDFKTVRGRLEALDEACRIAKGMFTADHTTVDGRHFVTDRAMGHPRPVQDPHPPILIGGRGEKILLRLVAEHADMWNTFGAPDEMKRLIGILDRHGEEVGRDTTRIEKTVAALFGYTTDPDRQKLLLAAARSMTGLPPEEARKQVVLGSKDECLETIARYVEAGVTHFIFMTFAPWFEDEIQGFAEEVIPAARSLGPPEPE